MAKFVLAGRTDCPLYAKAELLADSLQRSLPDFSIHKISILPGDWEEWLEACCKKNGWKHQQSPLVWRELVAQGGEGMLLGGFSDFLEHCQDYYSFTSDMPSEIMLSVAAENLEARMNLVVEEQQLASLFKPFHIWISSALSPTCLSLIPNLLSLEVFPGVPAISLHLLDLEGSEQDLHKLRIQTEDLANPLLHQVTAHANLEQAFREADLVLLLEERFQAEGRENDEEEKLQVISDRYGEYGRLIDTRAKKEVKVIVSGDTFVNLRCAILLEKARSVDSRQFVTMATRLKNIARAVVAEKLKVTPSDVTNVIVWGNISGSFYVDLQRANVFNYDGAIKGPAFFSQPVHSVLHERQWFESVLQDTVRSQRQAAASGTCQTAATSIANGILSVLEAWNGPGVPDEIFSVGVLCKGHFNLPDGMVLSVPVTFENGQWSVLLDVTVGDSLKERLQLAANELRQHCQVTKE